MKNVILYLSVSILSAFAGCKKGDTGPAGTNGVNGTNGNANVRSKTFVVNPSDWVVNSSNLTRFLTDSDITQDIIDKGSVEMFIQAGVVWWPLPYTSFSSSYSTTFQGAFYVNDFDIFVYRSDGLQPVVPGVALTFKVVTIAGSAFKANPNVNWKNYEEIKRTFNLKD